MDALTRTSTRSRPLFLRLLVFTCFLTAVAGLPMQPISHAQTTDPAVVGQWSGLLNWPIVAVHTHMLPNGKVMFYPYGDDPRQWDPANNSITTLTKVGYNIFCTGHSLMADGRLLVSGGHIENGVGLNDASIYDSVSNTWTRLPDMNAGRWYPTNTTLPNGDVLVTSGSIDNTVGANPLAQVWQASSSTWRNLTAAQMGLPLYPWFHVAPNGRVFYSGPSQTTRYLDTAGSGAWTTVGNRTFGFRSYGTSVMYEKGKVFVVGGADPPTASAEVIDLNAVTPQWRAVTGMSIARRQLNATVMADGKVLVTGGSSAPGFNNSAGAVLYAETWDPASETWASMAGYQRYRGYHSTALLLPDGRVLSAGGDGQPNAEVFSPPYLFKGARPTISSAPTTVSYGQNFTVSTPEAANINKVSFIKLSSVTHAFNMDQRFCNLSFTRGSGTLTVTAPADANLAPPGHYMLFVLNGTGVPSVARIVRLGGTTPPPPPPPTFVAKVNFQPTNSTVPAGYVKDDGLVYGNRGNGYTYGWNGNNSSTTRDRNAANSPDQRYDTLIHMQKPVLPNATWEIAVPNGTYSVFLVAGDPSNIDSVYRINVEGALAINGTPTSGTRWFSNTVTVTVSDGRLTVSNATGSSNNKICFIDITRVN
jgi:galactose oxidase